MIDIYQEIFDNTFEAVLRTLDERAKRQGLTYIEAEHELESIYRYDGLDWGGRGEMKQAENDGTILAYQVFIDKNKKAEESVS